VERDSTGDTVTKCFFAEAEQMSGTKYYFTRDYLGGIREMTHSKGALCALYDNDLFGALLFAKSIRCSVLSLRRGFLFADESTLAPELGWHRYDREIPLRGCWRAGAPKRSNRRRPPVLNQTRGRTAEIRTVSPSSPTLQTSVPMQYSEEPTGRPRVRGPRIADASNL